MKSWSFPELLLLFSLSGMEVRGGGTFVPLQLGIFTVVLAPSPLVPR